MVNLEKKLTVDDLIITYLAQKLKDRLNPNFSKEEFIEFLEYYNKKNGSNFKVDNFDLYITDLINRKKMSDWTPTGAHINYTNGLVTPTYDFSSYDESVINVYFMREYEKQKIIDTIIDFLINEPDRSIDITANVEENELNKAKKFSAIMMYLIWSGYVKRQVDLKRWPSQCKDIGKYLIEDDLAVRIGNESIRDEILKFYNNTSHIVASLLSEDQKLKIRNQANYFLANSNYDLVLSGYMKLLNNIGDTGVYFDFETDTFELTKRVSSWVDFWDNPEYKQEKMSLSKNDQAIKIIKLLG